MQCLLAVSTGACKSHCFLSHPWPKSSNAEILLTWVYLKPHFKTYRIEKDNRDPNEVGIFFFMFLDIREEMDSRGDFSSNGDGTISKKRRGFCQIGMRELLDWSIGCLRLGIGRLIRWRKKGGCRPEVESDCQKVLIWEKSGKLNAFHKICF